jgi:hypothetical protein
MSMKYSWLCSRLNLYCDYYDAAATSFPLSDYPPSHACLPPISISNATYCNSSRPPFELINFVITIGDAMSFPILVITIITYYLISRMIKESVVLILLTTVVSYFAWMILAVTIFDYIPRWFTHIDIQISYIIGILLQVLIVNFVSRLYLKFNKSNSNKPL